MVLGRWHSGRQGKASKFWKARLGVDACSLDMTPWLNHLDWWRARLEYYGGAPTYLATLQAFTQAVEIADHLMCRTGIELIRILYALPFWVCRPRAGVSSNTIGHAAVELTH
jgi:hypothetical protein